MTASVVRRLLVAALGAAVVATGAPLVAWHLTPASATSASPAPRRLVTKAVLVVRRAGDHDALWRLSPIDGTPTAAGDLPGFAGSVAVSPDGQNVAYLPSNGAARVWIGSGPLGPKTISLASAGVKRVHSFTWIDDERMLVAGVTRRSASYYQDRLYLVNAVTGKAASFRHLRGTEPSAAPALGKVAYVKLTVVRRGTAANRHTPTIRESLRIVRVAGGKGRTVLTDTYKLFVDHRSFAQPTLSPDGKWLLTGQTGSDVSVTYAVRDGVIGYPGLTVSTASLLAQAGWDAAGRNAFAGTPNVAAMDEACVWVCDADGGTLARTPTGLLPSMMITDLDWSADGELVAGALGSSRTRHVIVLSSDLSAASDLGTGRLPVWVPLL